MKFNLVDNYDYEIDEKKLSDYVKFLNEKLENTKIFSIVFVDDSEIQNINLEFRSIDRPTDVLSFEDFSDDYLGDIIISIDKLKQQAIDYSHTEFRELYFLITHGYLHLNGYDHLEPSEEKIMFDLQDSLLTEFNIERE